MSESDLATLQRSMLLACTSAGAISDADEFVKPSTELSAQARLRIYADGYLTRLIEGLKADFPVLRALVGDQVFGLFAKAYVWARPPTSPSMFDLGAGFADYLDETSPVPGGPEASLEALPAALARLERARAEAARARGVETDPAHEAVDVVAILTAPDLMVRAPQSLRVLRLPFALHDALTSADEGRVPATPSPADTHYAVARNRYRVRVHVITAWQHAVLRASSKDGATIRSATAGAAAAANLDTDKMSGAVLAWLPIAVDAGMVTVVKERERSRS